MRYGTIAVSRPGRRTRVVQTFVSTVRTRKKYASPDVGLGSKKNCQLAMSKVSPGRSR